MTSKRKATNQARAENLCDSTLTCHGKFYPVHRLVLSLCSEYFEKIYEKTPCKHPFLIINDIEPIHLEALLNFIYQGEVKVTQENLPKFIKAAEYLKIKGLISDADSRKKNVIYNAYDGFDIYSKNKSDCRPILNEDRKPNIRLNTVTHKNKNNCKKASIILNPHVPIERLTGCVYDSVLTVHNLEKPDKIKEENDFGLVNCNNKKQLRNHKKIDKAKARPKKIKFKLPNEPVRFSPRTMKPMVNYYIPETVINDFDVEDNVASNNDNINFIEEDMIPQITISSYSGGNCEEFNSIQNYSNVEGEDSVAVKVELTEYSIDENDLNVDCCGVKSELSTETDVKLFNGSSDLPGSSCNTGSDDDVYIDETYSCETFGDLLENYNKSVSFDTKPFSNDVEESHKPILISPTANKVCATSDNKKLTKKKLFSCKYCLYSTFSKYKLQKHMVLNHKSFNSIKKCKFCPYICREKYMIVHENAHSSTKSFKCKFCWYRSVRKKNVTAHQKLHIMSAGKVRNHKGSIKTKSTKKHELKMKNPKPAFMKQKSHLLQCQYCSYKGKSVVNTKAHERTHKSNILKCQNCDYTSGFKSAMTKHESIHKSSFQGLGKQKVIYTCHQCPYSSIHRGCVLRHQECHILKKPYKCTKCSYSTAGVSQIRSHELLHSFNEDVKFPLVISV